MPLNIKILIAAHKKYWMPDDDVYLPVHGGAAGKADLGYTRDDTGDNISEKNPNFCELTALYWAWKNLDADYVGLVHYRRYFSHTQWAMTTEAKRRNILRGDDFQRLLQAAPIIVPGKRNYFIETTQSQYEHAHYAGDLKAVKDLIHQQYPQYDTAFALVMQRTWGHRFNMFVMRRDYYDAYCFWLFSLLFELEKRLDISQYDTYQARVYGFLAERLLDVWLETNHVPYVEQRVSFLEKQNWLKKGGKFLKRKFFAKDRSL